MPTNTPPNTARRRATMRAWRAWPLAAAAWLLVAGAASALDEEFLPVDEAFRLHAERAGANELHLRWDIAPGYYLYRHRLRFDGEGLEQPSLPDGVAKHDEYFGDVEVYYGSLDARLALRGTPADPYPLTVGYQGCADAGLCYAPQTRRFSLASVGGSSAPIAPSAPGAPADQPIAGQLVAEDQALARRLAESGALMGLLIFFGLGLLLAFTPCVLPMVPILSGVLTQQGERLSTRGALALSSTYVLAMAATYALAGVAAALSGSNLQAAMQHPAVLVSFAVVFVLLALSMFGLYELRLPSGVSSALSRVSARQAGGRLTGAALMGGLSALVVSPCVAPPLVGALLYISQTGDAVFGGLALFALGLGMGLPLIVAGTAYGGALPRAGAWMEQVKWLFGFVLLGVAVWLLERALPDYWTMLAWAALGIGVAVWLGAFETQAGGLGLLRRGLGLSAAVWSVLVFIGAAMGGGDPAQPLRNAFAREASRAEIADAFAPVRDLNELRGALASTSQPALLDIYADWCVACKEMEEKVFPDASVRAAMAPYQLLRADVTDNNAEHQALQRAFGIVGPPALLVFGADGQEERYRRVVGEVDAATLAARLAR